MGKPNAYRQRDQRRATVDPTHRARHKAARAAWTPAVNTGTIRCYRADTEPGCPGLITPGQQWDIDQTPNGWHPSHTKCNRAAGARYGNQLRRTRRQPRRNSEAW